MTIRNLDAVFRPRSVAVIGASNRPRSVGAVLARNLMGAGFGGPVMPVNPKHRAIGATLAYPDVASLPDVPDLAVICTPPHTVVGLVAELGRRGTRGAVVITAGFGEGGDAEGAARLQAVREAARPHLLRIVGPNCLGVMVPGHGLNASFVHINPLPGDLAFVTQSGAIATAIVDWATHRGIGFSHVVSLGDMGDVDFGDMLDYLAADTDTRAILLYVESVTDARKFLSAGRIAARSKPVVVVKAGRSAAAARAAASHTGAMAGSDAVFDAAFRRAGMLRVDTLAELFDAVETLANARPPRGDRLMILTNGGGLGVMATEALEPLDGRLATLSDAGRARLDAVLPPTWSKANPVDIIGDAPGERYAAALEILLEEPEADAILVINCPTAVADSLDAAHATVETLQRSPRRPAPTVLTNWMGEGAAAEARALFAAQRLPGFETPDQAVRGFMHLVAHARARDQLMETPTAVEEGPPPDRDRAAALVAAARAAGRDWLDEAESKALLAAYGIPVVRTEVADGVEGAVAAAKRIGLPVALKILSPDVTHKSDVGGVRLNLAAAGQVRQAGEEMLRDIAALAPGARVQGFTVQEMAPVAGTRELIAGFATDPVFGPVVLFGHGGTETEVVADTALGLPPLNHALARTMMSGTRIWRLLQGYRSQPAADVDGVATVLVRLGQLASDLPELGELDINPLIAGPGRVLALDARIRLVPPGTRRPRPAIRPYPHGLERSLALRDGSTVTMRPMKPEDEPLLQEMIARSSAEDVRLRFFSPVRRLTHAVAARLTQLDYDREMALAAFAPRPDGSGVELLGAGRISADPDNIEAEYGIMVRTDLKGRGLGFALMQAIIDYARSRGLERIVGEVLRENTVMLAMAKELGFARTTDTDDPALVRVTLELKGAPS